MYSLSDRSDASISKFDDGPSSIPLADADTGGSAATPISQVRPRNAFADGIKSMFGAGGIAMDQYPAFAKNYVVQSDQPQQACDFLDAEMVAVCEENQGCSLECQAGVVLHFRAGKRVDADSNSIRNFIGEGFQLFQNVSERLQRNA